MHNPVNRFNSIHPLLYFNYIYKCTFKHITTSHKNRHKTTRMRRTSLYAAALFILFLLCVPVIISARHINRSPSRDGHVDGGEENRKDGIRMSKARRERLHWEGRMRRKDTLEIAGSRLPDCSHACGSCSPCRLVMVSFVCASLAEAESCPMAYKCMCHNKSYPVP